jgi:hypothetical protein
MEKEELTDLVSVANAEAVAESRIDAVTGAETDADNVLDPETERLTAALIDVIGETELPCELVGGKVVSGENEFKCEAVCCCEASGEGEVLSEVVGDTLFRDTDEIWDVEGLLEAEGRGDSLWSIGDEETVKLEKTELLAVNETKKEGDAALDLETVKEALIDSLRSPLNDCTEVALLDIEATATVTDGVTAGEIVNVTITVVVSVTNESDVTLGEGEEDGDGGSEAVKAPVTVNSADIVSVTVFRRSLDVRVPEATIE